MKKALIICLFILGGVPAAFAGSSIMWYNVSWGMKILLAFSMVLYFALASFVFSLIFWLTHKWISEDGKKKRK